MKDNKPKGLENTIKGPESVISRGTQCKDDNA